MDRISNTRLVQMIKETSGHAWPTCCPWAAASWKEIDSAARELMVLRELAERMAVRMEDDGYHSDEICDYREVYPK